jgi:glycosyltransferase involved in cell wall biosynthesis
MSAAAVAGNEAATAPVKVLHFVTGGFSGGATQVAIALVTAALKGQAVEPLLVLRRKPRTDSRRIDELRMAGIPVQVVPSWPRWVAIWQLVRICRRFKPDVLVAHGFSEHIWGRYAGLLAGVPKLVHVEHNTRERYTVLRRLQTRWLARRTARMVGCSEGVRQSLLQLGMPAERTMAIPNGVRLEPFATADDHPYAQRVPGIVMCARFAKQKDHLTLVRAVALLKQKGLTPPVLFAGGGKARHRRVVERLVQESGLQDQVQFLGLCRTVPDLLMRHSIFALISHYEGMPLALVEGMAAGCAVVGSAVPGIRELISDGKDGRLVPESDPVALAEVLESLLREPERAARLGAAAREAAIERHSLELMNARYETLFLQLAHSP